MKVKLFYVATITSAERVGLAVLGESGTDPQTGMKGKRLLRSDSSVLQACVLGLLLQGLEIRFRIVRFSRILRLLDPLAT